MVVDELSIAQGECYNSVHQLLDSTIPELDSKLRYLMSKPNEIPPMTRSSTTVQFPQAAAAIHHPTYTRPKDPAISTVSIKEKPMLVDTEPQLIAATSIMETIPIPIPIPAPAAPQLSPVAAAAPPLEVPIPKKPPAAITTIKTTAPPQPQPPPAKQANTIAPAKPKTHQKQNGKKTTNNVPATNGHRTSSSMKDLEHLKGLRMPLSEYLRKNRPDILLNVQARSSYIKKISEERKSQRAYRIINSLERIRISSKTKKRSASSNNLNNRYQQARQTAQRQPVRTMRNLDAPDYCVKHKLGEREMKQLTLKNYRRLPEVKKQKLEEVNKHLKEQYYRNRQSYGRMLLNNFKNGIINYPLRTSYDDRSITSSQSEYSMSQSADGTACSSLEPYY